MLPPFWSCDLAAILALRQLLWRCVSQPPYFLLFFFYLQVIAFTCCCITVLLLLASVATADWMLADGWREGLFMQCISPGAPTPLPFEMEEVPGCSKARSASKSNLKYYCQKNYTAVSSI
jgi:hypothetical protein